MLSALSKTKAVFDRSKARFCKGVLTGWAGSSDMRDHLSLFHICSRVMRSDDADSPPVELREHGSGQTTLQATRVNAKVEPSLATENQGTLTDV